MHHGLRIIEGKQVSERAGLGRTATRGKKDCRARRVPEFKCFFSEN